MPLTAAEKYEQEKEKQKEKEKVEKETDSKAEALQLLTENEDNLRKFSIHVQNKEEHLREMYEEIGKTYPEYKN